MNDFTCKPKSNFCHTYRLNQLEEQVENWYEARFNTQHQRGAFLWLEMNQVGERRDTNLHPTLVRSQDRFLYVTKRKGFHLNQTNRIKE